MLAEYQELFQDAIHSLCHLPCVVAQLLSGSCVLAEYQELFQDAIKSLQQQGGQQVNIDFSPFATTAKLLYESAFVAERYSGIRGFLDSGKVCFSSL